MSPGHRDGSLGARCRVTRGESGFASDLSGRGLRRRVKWLNLLGLRRRRDGGWPIQLPHAARAGTRNVRAILSR